MMDTRPMGIGRLARRTGTSVKALRFYDSHGLLLSAGRSAANYRLFPEDAVICVHSVRTLKAAALTIRDLRELVAADRAGGDPDVLLRRKLTQVLERLNREKSELQTRRATAGPPRRRAGLVPATGTGSAFAINLIVADRTTNAIRQARGLRVLTGRSHEPNTFQIAAGYLCLPRPSRVVARTS